MLKNSQQTLKRCPLSSDSVPHLSPCHVRPINRMFSFCTGHPEDMYEIITVHFGGALGDQIQGSHMLGKHTTPKLSPQPLRCASLGVYESVLSAFLLFSWVLQLK